ncbi:MAG: amino acid ABC transporter substrate-binding protein [Deltaproteobacteria bacterium HGW-Deltaproteobacteria-15]|nr:MAG: amino acid ABC transporter substrate-binding protein [Deltaproteobacteria bacterium HGW-Deltaproteobacteria-15]
MSKKRHVTVAVPILLGIIAAGILLFSGPMAEARNIKVGVIDAYTGPAAVFAKDALNGFKLAVDEINKEGLLGGKIEFTTRDTKFKVDIGLNVAKELVMNEKVDLLVGTINSGVALAVSDAVSKKEKVPLIVWISKSENITVKNGHRYVFSTADNTAQAGKVGAVALAKKPYAKYYIAGDDYAYGHDLAISIWNNLKALKPQVEKVGESWWKLGEPDLMPYLTTIMAAKPDAVIFCTGGQSMANVLKAVKTTGMLQKIPVYVHTATDHAVLKPLGADAPEGVMGTMHYHFYYPEIPENKAFVQAFEKAYKEPPGFPAFNAYVTGLLIKEGFKKAGAIDREKFVDALEGLKISTPIGKLEMRACDHQMVYPMFLGSTKMDPGKGYAISSGIVTLPGEDILPTCDEVKKARGQ